MGDDSYKQRKASAKNEMIARIRNSPVLCVDLCMYEEDIDDRTELYGLNALEFSKMRCKLFLNMPVPLSHRKLTFSGATSKPGVSSAIYLQLLRTF